MKDVLEMMGAGSVVKLGWKVATKMKNGWWDVDDGDLGYLLSSEKMSGLDVEIVKVVR